MFFTTPVGLPGSGKRPPLFWVETGGSDPPGRLHNDLFYQRFFPGDPPDLPMVLGSTPRIPDGAGVVRPCFGSSGPLTKQYEMGKGMGFDY